MPNIVSLFSGRGGLDLGVEQRGYNTIWANDFRHEVCETFRNHFGNVIMRTLVKVVAKRDTAVPTLNFPTARPQFNIYRVRRLEHFFKRRDMNRASHYEKLLLFLWLS